MLYRTLGAHTRSPRAMRRRLRLCLLLLLAGGGTAGEGGSNVATVGCAACGGIGLFGGLAKCGAKGCASGAGKAATASGIKLGAEGAAVGAGKVVTGVGVKAGASKGVAVGAGAALGERKAAEFAGREFMAAADATTLQALERSPQFATHIDDLRALPRAPEARRLYLEQHPDLAREVGRYLEARDIGAFQEALMGYPRPNFVAAAGNDAREVHAAATLQDKAYTTTDAVAARLSTIDLHDVARLRAEVATLQRTLPTQTRLSVAGDGAYIEIRVTDGTYSYSAKVDLVSISAGAGGVKLTDEAFTRLSADKGDKPGNRK
jgi:hypothetical protein